MADLLKKKKYGLILSKKKSETAPVVTVAPAFADDNAEEEKVDVMGKKQSASTMRVNRNAERIHELALAEDPSVFDYDASYDQIQADKNVKVAKQKEADKNRKSKYAEDIIKAHQRREIEKQSREERKQQKERDDEGDEFADKEVFVTGAYRKTMEEVAKLREEEEYEDRFNKLTAVDHQKMWQQGFGRTLLNDLARDAPAAKVEKAAIDKKPSKTKNIRKRHDSRSQSPDEFTAAKPEKKSIYSDDEEGPSFKPPVKNFPSELRPGLNTVAKKAVTKSEKVRQRMFTPTPPSSDDEAAGDRRRQNRRDEKIESQEDNALPGRRNSHKESLSKLVGAKGASKEDRLARIKEILKQRNGPKEISEFRKRYLERKASGVVVPPL